MVSRHVFGRLLRHSRRKFNIANETTEAEASLRSVVQSWPFPSNSSTTIDPNAPLNYVDFETVEPFDWSKEEIFDPPPILQVAFQFIANIAPSSQKYIDSLWDKVASESKLRLERELDEVYVDSLTLNATHRVLAKMLEQDLLRLQAELRSLTAEAATRELDRLTKGDDSFLRELEAASRKRLAAKQDEASRVGRQIVRLREDERERLRKFKERNEKIRGWHQRQSSLAILLDYGVKAITPLYYLILLAFASLSYLFTIWRQGRRMRESNALLAAQVERSERVIKSNEKLSEEVCALHDDVHWLLPIGNCKQTDSAHRPSRHASHPKSAAGTAGTAAATATAVVGGSVVEGADAVGDPSLAEGAGTVVVMDDGTVVVSGGAAGGQLGGFRHSHATAPGANEDEDVDGHGHERVGGGGGGAHGGGDDVDALRLRLLSKALESMQADVAASEASGLAGVRVGGLTGVELVTAVCAVGSMCLSGAALAVTLFQRR